VADPHNPAVSHTITREDGGMVVRTRVDDRVREAVVRFMMGSGDKGVTLIGREDDGTTREIRLSHYPGHGWDRTTGHPEAPASPDGYLGEPMAADSQRRCLTCHTTDFRSAATGEGPAGGDRAIGCERCHGPGGNHLLAVDRGLADPLIGRPRLATAGQTIALCGQCHRPLSDAPPPDDDPNTVRFQASTLVRSACYIQSPGTFDCVTCHDPHHDATPDRAFYEQVCLACHSRPEDSLGPVRTGARMPVAAADLLEPSGRVPCPVEPKAGCVECHMPISRSAMLHSTFTDHYIRVHPRPDPGASKEAAGGSGGPP
jgi:nitrate reductase cytochrome c-type subunit